MQQCIYATDMGRHVSDLKEMKDWLARNNIQTSQDEIVSENYAAMEKTT